MQREWVVSPDYKAVIAAIANVRTSLGVSQRELARRLSKPPSFVNKIEQLERRLDVLEFIAIAEALETTAPSLMASLRAALRDDFKL
ncbi:helix-turn-helix transcriptional regulator [Sphingomonas aerolata]|jgi:transcriptional regulator with XRE-family HTH domain|uniref:helix-turn-helix domain-containing protein n=1 Tax=Sphingomonas aerolata TaxID=185951 RepID=UPI0033479FB9